MSFSLIYLTQRFFYRIYEFIKHWYVGGFWWFVRNTINLLESLDRSLAIKVTFRYWPKPLYQDYSLAGYFFGFLFRTARLIIGGLVYGIVCCVAFLLYAIWAAILPAIVYKGVFNNQ